MNLYGIYKRNTIDDIPEMNALLDDTATTVTDAACTM